MVEIRDATPNDAGTIARITNALLTTTTYAWTDEPWSPERIADHLRLDSPIDHPTLVAVTQGEVVGWAGYGDFREQGRWEGYQPTVESSVHLDERWWGRGIGRRLMTTLVDRARTDGRHVMVAAIDGSNDGSIRFHERLGFAVVGRMPELGTKFGRRLDLVLMQRFVDDG